MSIKDSYMFLTAMLNAQVKPLYDTLARVGPIDLAGTASKCLAENAATWKEVVDKEVRS